LPFKPKMGKYQQLFRPSLKKAYPNYFADTTEFEKLLLKVYQANNAIHATSA